MPTKPGEYCTRCGKKSTQLTEGQTIVYYCPVGHGEQARYKIEPEPEAEPTESE